MTNFRFKIPKILRNKFVVTILIFIIWVVFFDQNNLINRMKSYRQLKKMRNDIEYYKEKMIEDSIKLHELLSNDENLEKFAREEYLMKKENEDIFIIEEK